MHPRPRPRIVDKQRPEAVTKKDPNVAKPSDHNMNMGVPNKLRHGADEAYAMLARRNAAMGR